MIQLIWFCFVGVAATAAIFLTIDILDRTSRPGAATGVSVATGTVLSVFTSRPGMIAGGLLPQGQAEWRHVMLSACAWTVGSVLTYTALKVGAHMRRP